MSGLVGSKTFILVSKTAPPKKYKADRLELEGEKVSLMTQGCCIAVLYLSPGEQIVDEASIVLPEKKVEGT